MTPPGSLDGFIEADKVWGKSRPYQLSWPVVIMHILPYTEEATELYRKTKTLNIFLPKSSNTFSTAKGTGGHGHSATCFQTGL